MSATELNQLVLNQNNNPSKYAGLDNTAIRTIEEVKGAIMIAKMCPRNEDFAIEKILKSCNRKTLAETALYEYERGGTPVEGPSIRLAEAVALHWGNIQYGIRTLDGDDDETEYEAFAWDVENNVRASKKFSVKHGRYTKSSGFKKVDDPRDIYEVVANHGARRLRACIIEVIPGDVMDCAVDACKKTLLRLAGEQSKEERTKIMLDSFAEYGVTKAMIEKKYGCKVEALSEGHLVKLRAIYQGFNDGYARPENVFEFTLNQTSKAEELMSKLKT